MKKKTHIKICIINITGLKLYRENINIQYGGAEVQLYLLTKELAKDKNLDINVIMGINELTKKKEYVKGKIKLFVNLPLMNIFFNFFKRPLIFFLTLLKINPDLVIQRGAGVYTGICALYCKIFRKKFIFSIANRPDIDGTYAKKGIIGKIYKFGLLNSNLIIAQHFDQVNLLRRWQQNKDLNIKLIRTAYNIQRNEFRKREFILWVGRAVFWKRPELFILLAKKFSTLDFIIICNKGKNKIYFDFIKKSSKKCNNIKFIEYVSFKKIDNYFRRAKVLINTSSYEGFPNTFIQAFKNGTPVISLKINPEQIFHKFNIGFFCKNDFDSMIIFLNKLLRNNYLYSQISNNAFNYADKYHNIKNISKKWKDLIYSLNY